MSMLRRYTFVVGLIVGPFLFYLATELEDFFAILNRCPRVSAPK